MKRSMTRGLIALSAAMVLGLFGTAPTQAQEISEIQQEGLIKVGMLVDFPPVGFMNSDNEPDGYDADIAALLADRIGVDLTIVPVTGPNRIPYLLSGQVDLLISSLAITEDAPRRWISANLTPPCASAFSAQRILR